MGVVTTKSTLIQHLEAVPQVRDLPYAAGGKMRVYSAAVEIASGDDDGSIYALARLHSSDRVQGIFIMNDAIGGGTDYDIGLYKWTDGAVGAEKDKDLFADGISMASARTTAPYNAAWATLDWGANIGKTIWQMLGLSQDPGEYYALCATANTAGTVSGSLGVDAIVIKE